MPVSVVTGGSGFLGSHLSDKLLAEGHEVIALDNLITGNVANIEHLAGNRSFRFIHQAELRIFHGEPPSPALSDPSTSGHTTTPAHICTRKASAPSR